jgi:hypothetical protein
VGFSFRERMSGTFHLLSEPLVERAISVEIEAHVRNMRMWIASVTGRIRAEGITGDTPVQGTLGLHALHERRIPYALHFGHDLRLVGEKDLSWLAPVETLVVLPFTIVEGDTNWKETARGTLRFDVHQDLRSLVRSLRVFVF